MRGRVVCCCVCCLGCRKGVPTRCEFVESLAQFVRESDLATAELESIIEHTGMEGATATNDDRQMQEEQEQERKWTTPRENKTL